MEPGWGRVFACRCPESKNPTQGGQSLASPLAWGAGMRLQAVRSRGLI